MASASSVTGRSGAGSLAPHNRSICALSAALAVPSLPAMPAPLIRTRSPDRSMATHHCANLASSARVGSLSSGRRKCIISPMSRRDSTVSHSTTVLSTEPVSSITPAARSSAATGCCSALRLGSTLGKCGPQAHLGSQDLDAGEYLKDPQAVQ